MGQEEASNPISSDLGINSGSTQENKQDNTVLKQEIESLRQELASLKAVLSGFSNILSTQKTENPTDGLSTAPFLSLFSIGNKGVQTDQQTDNLTTKETALSVLPNQDMLSLVESLKSDLKIKFRNLTKQEFKVFSAIYVLEEQGQVDYRSLASYLGLSEGSIRDYIMKMERKEIPVVKVRINNKKVVLTVRQELKQIVSLDTLMKVREPVFK